MEYTNRTAMRRDALANTWTSPAEEELADALSLDEWLLADAREASVLVPVETDAMEGAGILRGDVVLLARGREPRSGDLVLAEAEGAHLLRRYERRGERIRLLAARPDVPPLEPPEGSRIVGTVTAVIRKYR